MVIIILLPLQKPEYPHFHSNPQKSSWKSPSSSLAQPDLMGNIIGSFISGFAKVLGNLFGTPLDFLAGKSCSSVCGSTWDFICYIENFCIANLVKMAMVLALFYIVLLFFYLLYKLGICDCVCRSLCKMVWACFASCFSAGEYGCTFLWVMLKRIKRQHKRDIEEFDSSEEDDESFSYHAPRSMEVRRSSLSRRWRDYRGGHLRRSLRPRSHRIRVGISRRNPIKHGNHVSTVHDIRVTRTSKFVQKGTNYKGEIYQRRRW